MFEFLIIVSLMLFMAKLSRMSGGAKPSLPFGLDQWVLAIPYGALTYFISSTFIETNWIVAAVTALGYLAGVFSERAGHGSFMTLPYSIKKIKEKEWGDPILTLFFGLDPRNYTKSNATAYQDIRTYGETKLYLRNLCGLALNGTFPFIIPIALLLGFGEFWLAAILLIGGISKATAYNTGWDMFPNGMAPWYIADKHNNPNYKYPQNELQVATEWGEFLDGAFKGLFIAMVALHLL